MDVVGRSILGSSKSMSTETIFPCLPEHREPELSKSQQHYSDLLIVLTQIVGENHEERTKYKYKIILQTRTLFCQEFVLRK